MRRVPVVNVAFQTQRKKGGHVDSQFDRQTRQRRQNQLLCHQQRPVVQLNLLTLEDKDKQRVTGKAETRGRKLAGRNNARALYIGYTLSSLTARPAALRDSWSISPWRSSQVNTLSSFPNTFTPIQHLGLDVSVLLLPNSWKRKNVVVTEERIFRRFKAHILYPSL